MNASKTNFCLENLNKDHNNSLILDCPFLTSTADFFDVKMFFISEVHDIFRNKSVPDSFSKCVFVANFEYSMCIYWAVKKTLEPLRHGYEEMVTKTRLWISYYEDAESVLLKSATCLTWRE